LHSNYSFGISAFHISIDTNHQGHWVVECCSFSGLRVRFSNLVCVCIGLCATSQEAPSVSWLEPKSAQLIQENEPAKADKKGILRVRSLLDRGLNIPVFSLNGLGSNNED
jgi:hypothetical protein